MTPTGTSRGRRPTLRDVAQLAGVSFKTVSRVVNAEPGVSPVMAERVREAVAELGYRPDPAASSLRRADGRTMTIAVILEDLANPFPAALHSAVVGAMRAREVLVLSATSGESPEDERDVFMAFADRRVDGHVLMPTSADHAWMHSERIGARHVVMVDRPAPGFAADVVTTDHRGGAEQATAHLARHGHRRIAFLGDLPAIWTAAERHAGYQDALQAAGLPRDERLERAGLRDSTQACEAVVELLTGPDPPTAIFAAQNLLTIGRSGRCACSASTARSRSPASTTWSSPTCSTPASPSSPRLPPTSGAPPPSSCCAASRATPRRRAPTGSRPA